VIGNFEKTHLSPLPMSLKMIKRYSGSLAVKTPVEFVAIIFNA
jgi:hypothetical protein